PHWAQAGTISFITWRTWDSIPTHVLEKWLQGREAWLKQQGIDPASPIWTQQLNALGPRAVQEFQQRVSDRWNEDLDACHSWKHYTATKINRCLQRRGRFWQQDGFDHLVRTEEQFEYLRSYIANNPPRANLREGEYIHWTKRM